MVIQNWNLEKRKKKEKRKAIILLVYIADVSYLTNRFFYTQTLSLSTQIKKTRLAFQFIKKKDSSQNFTNFCCYKFLFRLASSVLRVNCYQRGSCVGGPSMFNSPFGQGSRSRNIRPLDNHLPCLSIWFSSLALSRVYRLTFFKSLV